jgi:hypothetical protein
MSHFTEMKVNFQQRCESSLVEALKAKFGEQYVKVNEDAVKLTGYDAAAQKRAHIVVKKEGVALKNKRNHAYNDLGYERQPDGSYRLHYDPMDVEKGLHDELAQDYAVRVSEKQLELEGYTVTKSYVNGEVELVASKW